MKSRKRFTTRIQPVDFAVQHANGLARQAVAVRETVFQILQPEAHGVQRIFHFVRHARGDAPERRQALGNLQLPADALERFQVARM